MSSGKILVAQGGGDNLDVAGGHHSAAPVGGQADGGEEKFTSLAYTAADYDNLRIV